MGTKSPAASTEVPTRAGILPSRAFGMLPSFLFPPALFIHEFGYASISQMAQHGRLQLIQQWVAGGSCIASVHGHGRQGQGAAD